MFRVQKITLMCALVALAALLAFQPAIAQTIFFEDFESTDGSDWIADNAGQKWAIDAFPNGTQGLRNTEEGCGLSGNTPIPGVTNFSDGVIQLEMSWGDDDSWGIVMRQSAPDKGYLIVFGYNETPAVIVALLDEGCAETGMCLDQTSCENNDAKTLIQVDHGLGGGLTQDNSVSYLGRIEARGDSIKVWFLPTADVSNPNAADLGVAPLVEIQDGTHQSGAVGVWQESQGNCAIDNVWVSGPVAVQPQGKLAASWATIKSTY